MNFDKILDLIENKFNAKLYLDEVSFFKMENELEIILCTKDYIEKNTVIEFLIEYFENFDFKTSIEIKEISAILDDFKNTFPNQKITQDENNITICVNHNTQREFFETNKEFKKFEQLLNKLDINLGFLQEKIPEDEFLMKTIIEKEEEINQEIKKSIELKNAQTKKIKKIDNNAGEMFTYGSVKSAPAQFTDLQDLNEDINRVKVKGKVYELNISDFEKGSWAKFDLDNGNFAISCKLWVRKDKIDNFKDSFKEGKGYIVSGIYNYDDFEKERVLNVNSIEETVLPERIDLSENKRVELNIHTKYSQLESVVDLSSLFSKLSKWGHKSVGITDLFNVQAFPEISQLSKRFDIKVNLGLQTNLINDEIDILTNYYNIDISNKDFVVFDIETTGLSNFTDKIIEIGAVRIRNNEIIDKYQEFVNPNEPLSAFTTELTGITTGMVANADNIETVLPRFLEFIKNSVLVAHNAEFDVPFIIEKANQINCKFKPVYIDTLYLSRALNQDFKNHKLDTLTKEYQVNLLNHHRAIDDAIATAEVFLKMLEQLKQLNISIDNKINYIKSELPISQHKEFQSIIYVRNKTGLKNLYTIVSKSNIEYYNREPGIPISVADALREGLLIGTGNYKSKLFNLVALEYEDDVLEKELEFFDFISIVPIDFAKHLVNRGYIRDENHLIKINKKLVELAKKQDKLFIAIGDVYYIDRNEYPFRNVIKNFPRKRGVENSGAFYLKTTEEMLDNHDYLDEETRYDLVIRNTQEFDNLIENVSPIADGTFPPKIKDAEEILRNDAYEKAKSIYGENLPEIVKNRLERELNSIISNGYASLYMISKKLVNKSNEEGYLVGSRGSVGSSFAATMSDITEVNPLTPHYICEHCNIADFDIDLEKYPCGIDLPDKKCDKCSNYMKKDGFDIPFEVFLGFEGDKEPDIDLNFASVYQSRIHKYTEQLFGKGKVFRAGTLSTIAEKTAYGMAIKYNEFYPDDELIRNDNANKNRVKRAITDVKRSTGQHAGGLIIVPDDKDIEDFTPIQYPADNTNSDVITTHFDYHAIDKNLLKLDLLGHNSPTIIRLLSDMSGIDAVKVDLSDEKTMSIFRSTEALNIKHEYTNINDGSLGIPEFGTHFVRGMLKDTKPTTFEELIRISGLSHGTNVWLGNAQELIKKGTTDLKGAICTRDDIMTYLISRGLDSKISFDIMEQVRKGKGLNDDQIKIMKENNIPQWYIDSCQKISYMFPKAHAVAYVMMSFRIAYFKVHHPEYYYAVIFTNDIQSFKYKHISKGLNYITLHIQSLRASEEFEVNSEFYIYELAEEMYARDIKLAKVDIYKSHPTEFRVIDKNTLLPPLMAVPNLSESMAITIDKARQDGEFISKEDFKNRTKTNRTAMESMNELGLFEGLQDTNQIDFFSF